MPSFQKTVNCWHFFRFGHTSQKFRQFIKIKQNGGNLKENLAAHDFESPAVLENKNIVRQQQHFFLNSFQHSFLIKNTSGHFYIEYFQTQLKVWIQQIEDMDIILPLYLPFSYGLIIQVEPKLGMRAWHKLQIFMELECITYVAIIVTVTWPRHWI